jgi:hypothetical protein
MTASLVFDGNAPFLCFVSDQTRSYCKEGAKWAEEYGGCPYWSCKVHWITGALKSSPGNMLKAYCDGSKFYLDIPDP